MTLFAVFVQAQIHVQSEGRGVGEPLKPDSVRKRSEDQRVVKTSLLNTLSKNESLW